MSPRETLVFKGESLKLQCQWTGGDTPKHLGGDRPEHLGGDRPEHLGFHLTVKDRTVKRIHNTRIEGGVTQAWIYIDEELMSYNCQYIHIRCVQIKEDGTYEQIKDDTSWFMILGGKFGKVDS